MKLKDGRECLAADQIATLPQSQSQTQPPGKRNDYSKASSSFSDLFDGGLLRLLFIVWRS